MARLETINWLRVSSICGGDFIASSLIKDDCNIDKTNDGIVRATGLAHTDWKVTLSMIMFEDLKDIFKNSTKMWPGGGGHPYKKGRGVLIRTLWGFSKSRFGAS